MSIIVAVLLIGDPVVTSLPGVQAEAASDKFTACFEPLLVDDPVINAPLTEKIPFEALDNAVSNAAFQACANNLVNGKAYQGGDNARKQLDGMRLMAARMSFYSTRGQINLDVRRKIRPYLGCIEKELTSAEPTKANLQEAVPLMIESARDTCSSQKPDVQFSGSEEERAIRDRLLAKYFDGFASDVLTFRFKAPSKRKANAQN